MADPTGERLIAVNVRCLETGDDTQPTQPFDGKKL